MSSDPNSIDVWETFLDPQGDYSLPDFSQVTPESMLSAVHTATDYARAEVAAIIADDTEVTFFSTTVRFESATVPMSRITSVLNAIESNHFRPELHEAFAEARDLLSATETAILLDVDLFHRIEQVHVTDLNPEDKRQQELTVDRFVRAGARLGEEEREQMTTIAAELTTLATSFSRALQTDTQELAVHLSDAEQLVGLSEDQIAAAAARAAERGLDGFLLTLNNFTQQLALGSLEVAQTRRHVLSNSTARGSRGGEGDTRTQVADTTALRALQAMLLGYPSYSSYAIDNQTAGNPDAAADIVSSLIAPANAQLDAELATVKERYGLDDVPASDVKYYLTKFQHDEYGIDPDEVAKYFEFDTVLTEGVFRAATGLYGITFAPREGIIGWHEDVRAFEVTDANERPLGLVLLDPYSRDTKRGGAWMDELVPSSRLTGHLPVVTLSLNLAKPGPGRPTLLNPTELTTLFHEFGHVLHGLFANSTYPSTAGTSVPRDYVEFPSQLNEMWAFHPQVLPHFAKHVDTGEPMPATLVDALIESEKFGQGFSTIEYLAAAMLDLSWHSLEAGEHITDVLSFESEVLAAAGFSPLVPPRYRTPYFGHIFASGYAAGYYSYLYSEVIAAWVSEWFENQGGLNREAGDAFREAILAPGYSVDPMSAIEKFFGTRPDVAPLLRRRGLAEPVADAEPEPDVESEPEPTTASAAEAPDPHPNHEKVATALEAAGIEPRIELFADATPTAASAAAELGVEVGAIANSLIFSADGEPVLIMASGAHRVDTDHVAKLIGVDSLDRADKDFVRSATGQVIGGVAPCGHPQAIPTYVDVTLAAHPVLWAGAGTPNSMMPLTYSQLLAVTNGKEITVVADDA
ncbi:MULTISPECIES: M3 family metallopeptidase [unclassified Brevibacterium]|uniref:M3 family metallopeptidase n=1 Tax=unclassified Brevibacterium TaxID=2614124 RepID=UPI001E3B2AB3|nr:MULTISPECIES: M3 family metallopeptidase [unclassified Brevibacterium]MCD1287183.1 peptidyl-dipeptidase Dcp [Brevibacterium sp. CCUG 69071]MDK8436562.1 M3 family metallopeptidase [Brevibacterium sp. H-BE7]